MLEAERRIPRIELTRSLEEADCCLSPIVGIIYFFLYRMVRSRNCENDTGLIKTESASSR
jgi:hypothetical protein